ARGADVEAVVLADADEAMAREAEAFVSSDMVSSMTLDVADHQAVVDAMDGFDVAVSCVPYRFNYELTKVAIEAGTHLCDLGGNNDIVRKQLCLDARARKADVTIIPDCGLAPGLATVLAADALRRLDKVSELHLRVGGLPVDPQPPLDYMMLFNPAGLVNEYKERPVVIRGGRIQTVEPLDELEEIEFPEPFGMLEAFNTSGGTSTLPQTLLGKVDQLDYKTIRYPGHRDKVKAMMDLGLFDEDPVAVGDGEVVPRDLTETLLAQHLPREGEDVMLLRVWAEGVVEGRERTLTYTIIDRSDADAGLTAMQRTTAFPAAIVAHMVGSGLIDERGVVPQEQVVPTGRFFEELEKRDIHVDVDMM
ncbi:MAG: saccharopine dehydrogenase NADP-binding domain-containing protein, partial [Thermoplasmata archaeon]